MNSLCVELSIQSASISGDSRSQREMPAMSRFTISFHDCPDDQPRPSHWDLFLEEEGQLRTWAIAQEPMPNVELLAEQLSEHRLAYLEYEGPVSGNRGTVTRWDYGEYERIEATNDRLVLEMSGTRCAGRLQLTRDAERPQRWRVIWSRS
jgi:hypothetical protein